MWHCWAPAVARFFAAVGEFNVPNVALGTSSAPKATLGNFSVLGNSGIRYWGVVFPKRGGVSTVTAGSAGRDNVAVME
jgi:hypothetical protein